MSFHIRAGFHNGVLAYQAAGQGSRLAWLERSGREVAAVSSAGAYENPRLSPDGKNLTRTATNPNAKGEQPGIMVLEKQP